MTNWKFDEKNVSEVSFKKVEIGKYRCRIEAVEELQSKAGNDMYKITLELSPSGKLWHYIVFMPDKPEITNGNLKSIYDAFGIDYGNLQPQTWVGKVGGVKVKHEMYKGEISPKVHYFLDQNQTNLLPKWGDSENVSRETSVSNIKDADGWE